MAETWWVALACVRHQGPEGDAVTFIYGCAAPCGDRPAWRGIDTTGNCAFEVREAVVGPAEIAPFLDRLAAGHIEPAAIGYPDCPSVAVKDVRHSIGYALGHPAARFQTYHSVPDIYAVFGDTDKLVGLLEALEDTLGLPFKSTHAGHIGAFEVINLLGCGEDDAPVLLEKLRAGDLTHPGPDTLLLTRGAPFVAEAQRAHVVLRAGRNTIVDRLVALPAQVRTVTIEAPEKVDGFAINLFSEDGVLLYQEDRNFLRMVDVKMALAGQTYDISDELTERSEKHDPELGIRARRVRRHSSELTTFGRTDPGAARDYADKIYTRIAGAFSKGGPDRWFPSGIEGELGVIARVNALLDGHRVREAVLVDPWFGTDALRRVVFRLENSSLPLTLLTSWTETDPDTGEKLPPSAPGATRLQAALSRLKPHLSPHLRVLNLTAGAKQGFHDRYLMLRLQGVPTEVYLLSNSLNKAAGKWPFSMSRFTDEVARDAERYINGLCEGRDLSRDRPLTLTQLWPVDP